MYRLHKLPPIRIRNYEGLERSFSFWLFEIGSCELTDDEESPAGSGECHVDLVAVGDKAQVLTTPAVGGVGLYLVAGQGTHCAHDHVVPLPTCNMGTSWKWVSFYIDKAVVRSVVSLQNCKRETSWKRSSFSVAIP